MCISLQNNPITQTQFQKEAVRTTYVQGSVVLRHHAIGSVAADVGQHQKVDTVLSGLRGHTQSPCRKRKERSLSPVRWALP